MNTQPFVLKKQQHFPLNPLQLQLIFIAFPGRRPPCVLHIVMINTDIVQSPGMRISGDAHCESAPKLIQKQSDCGFSQHTGRLVMCVYVCVCVMRLMLLILPCVYFKAKQCGERKQPQDKVSFCSSDCLLSFVMDSLIKKI